MAFFFLLCLRICYHEVADKPIGFKFDGTHWFWSDITILGEDMRSIKITQKL
jgi:hypothetical protein